MDPVLGLVTLAALLLAVIMTVVAVRLLRSDRQRRAARIAALEAAAWGHDESVPSGDTPDAPEWDAMAGDDLPLDLGGPVEATAPFAPVERAAPVRRAPIVAPTFAATNERPAPARRWLALVAVVAVMAALGTGAYFLLTPATVRATGTDAAGPAAVTPAPDRTSTGSPQPRPARPGTGSGAPLELLSLKHAITGTSLRVTGLVENPRDGVARDAVVAIVYAFDATGAFSASARATIEFTGIRPGEESPFVVTVPDAGTVSRYRVGFRTPDGRVIAHVDHRGQAPAGTTEGR